MALCFLQASVAFSAPPLPQLQVQRCPAAEMAIAKPSKAMPFLTAPACQSSGLPGAETGFDPLYFSDFLDIKWLREAELKHGRICMLATTGLIVQEFFSLPGYPGYSPNPVEAFSSVPPEALAQIFGFMAWLELYYFNDGKWTMMNMFEDKSRVPGDLGFDPLKFGENPATRERLELYYFNDGKWTMMNMF